MPMPIFAWRAGLQAQIVEAVGCLPVNRRGFGLAHGTGQFRCGGAPSRALTISETLHAKILRAYVPTPEVKPRDTVWWHPDVIHGAEDRHTGTGYSDVMHIGAAPACAKNERFPVDQRRAFEAGECSPDFAVENYGVDFESRFTADMLSPLMTGPDGI
jgi:hypothetical protein